MHYYCQQYVPWTDKIDEIFVDPSEFVAMHVYSVASSGVVFVIVNELANC